MRRNIAFWMLAMALTATTLAWAGDTAGPGTSCPPGCQPCAASCATSCPFAE